MSGLGSPLHVATGSFQQLFLHPHPGWSPEKMISLGVNTTGMDAAFLAPLPGELVRDQTLDLGHVSAPLQEGITL